MQNRIMYVCESCADGAPEDCGHYDRNEVRVMADGRWLCETCYENEMPDDAPLYAEHPAAPEYAVVPARV